MLNTVKKITPWIVIVATAYFFSAALIENWQRIEEVSFTPNYQTIIGTVLFALAVVVSGLLWGRVLSRISGVTVSSKESIRIHCASWLLKYVPGQVGSYINKITWGKRHGLSKKAVSNSFIYENVMMVLAGTIPVAPFLLLLFLGDLDGNLTILLPVLAVVPMLIIMNKKTFYWIASHVFKKILKKEISHEYFLETKELLRYQAGYILPRILNGTGFVFITASILTVSPGMYLGLGATYILAGVIGMMAIFVPSGIGVREGVIVLFASTYFPVEEAILISVIARFYATIADIGVVAVYLILNKGKIRQT